MSFDEARATLDGIISPVGHDMPVEVARWFAQLEPDPEVEDRLDKLGDLNSEDRLSEQERAEYETLVKAGNFVAVLRAKARNILKAADAAQ